jgi:hypothetical protein
MKNPPNLIDKPHAPTITQGTLLSVGIANVLLVVLRPDHPDYQGILVSDRLSGGSV